MTWQNYYT